MLSAPTTTYVPVLIAALFPSHIILTVIFSNHYIFSYFCVVFHQGCWYLLSSVLQHPLYISRSYLFHMSVIWCCKSIIINCTPGSWLIYFGYYYHCFHPGQFLCNFWSQWKGNIAQCSAKGCTSGFNLISNTSPRFPRPLKTPGNCCMMSAVCGGGRWGVPGQ